MTKLGRSIRAASFGVLATALALLATAGPAAAETLVVQSDGKIVVLGQTYPEFGALARLNPDGTLDPSFGQGGFAIDQRTPNFSAVALQPDGRIATVMGPGSVLGRYLANGASDPSFAGGGQGGTNEPEQPYYSGPPTLLVQPGGGLLVAGNRLLGAGSSEAWVRRYDANGALLETAGRVPRQGVPLSSAGLTDLLERADGSLIGAGWTYGYEDSEFRFRSLLVKFLPGSGLTFDPSFGAGAGLVRPEFPRKPNTYSSGFTALAQVGDKLLVAGKTAGTFLVARFGAEGDLDPSFGEGGYAAPPIVGPGEAASKGSIEGAASGAEDLAVMPDGDIVLGGGTSQWSSWEMSKMTGLRCVDCPQPLLVRFDENGKLDPSFGSGGILRLLEPDGSTFVGAIGQVTALPDGKILVNGFYGRPFVARLNPDGSYDPSFGQGGLATLQFPCTDQGVGDLRREGCLPSALLTARLRGLRRGKPALFLRVAPNLPWGAIEGLDLHLPHGVRLTKRFRSRLRVTAVGGSGSAAKVEVTRPKRKGGRTELFFTGFGEARELRVKLRRGSLRATGRHRPRRALRLPMQVTFADATFRELFESTQKLVRRVRSTG
jgi:uncharacterized delta-60 repeat protein